MIKKDVLALQRRLNREGFSLVEDGIYGPATAAAYQHYLDRQALPAPPASKPWWTSRALLGAVATILVSAGGLFMDLSSVDRGELTDVLVALSTGVAGLLALWGTVRRQAPIDPTLIAPGVRLRAASRSGSDHRRTGSDHRRTGSGSLGLFDESVPTGPDADVSFSNQPGATGGPFWDSRE